MLPQQLICEREMMKKEWAQILNLRKGKMKHIQFLSTVSGSQKDEIELLCL